MDSTNITGSTDTVVESSSERYYGEPSLAINTAYVKAALSMLVAGAKFLRLTGKVNATTLENPITYLIDKEMRVFQRSSGSDIVRWILQPNIQRDLEDPLLRCIPDFMFTWEEEEMEPDLCLYAEAKRLFGTGASLADKYVKEGVLDFVEARYGRNHNYGIMIGYILTDPPQKAVQSVKNAMDTRATKIAEISAFSSDSSLCSHPYTHHSSHLQSKTEIPIILVHLFLDFT